MPLSGLGSNPGSSNSRFIAPVVISLVLQVALASHISILGGTFNLAVALACALAPALAPGRAALAGCARPRAGVSSTATAWSSSRIGPR